MLYNIIFVYQYILAWLCLPHIKPLKILLTKCMQHVAKANNLCLSDVQIKICFIVWLNITCVWTFSALFVCFSLLLSMSKLSRISLTFALPQTFPPWCLTQFVLHFDAFLQSELTFVPQYELNQSNFERCFHFYVGEKTWILNESTEIIVAVRWICQS